MILFFSDITGINDEKKRRYRSAFGDDIQFVSPYIDLSPQQLAVSFDDDYQRFCSLVGIESYCQIVQAAIDKVADKPFVAIGESVGATALWRCSELSDMQNCQTAICLYGSRIRDCLDVSPVCPVKLWFSCDEAYFVDDSVIAKLNQQPLIEVELSELNHGYASPTHEAFNKVGFEHTIAAIKHIIKR